VSSSIASTTLSTLNQCRWMTHRPSLRLRALSSAATRVRLLPCKRTVRMQMAETASYSRHNASSSARRRQREHALMSSTAASKPASKSIYATIRSFRAYLVSSKPSARATNHYSRPAIASSRSYTHCRIMLTCWLCKTMICKRSLTSSS